MPDKILAWHFCGDKLRDGREIPKDGVALKHDGKLILCESGLHASKKILDALQYAPGEILCRVEMSGSIIQSDDKLISSVRKILWRIDGEKLLQKFARMCALDVVHLWDAPSVVINYLKSGNEDFRGAAGAAARDAAAARAKQESRLKRMVMYEYNKR